MDAEELEVYLQRLFNSMDDIVDEVNDEEWTELLGGPANARSFKSAGILTNDSGLVLEMHDGSEFIITIQKRVR